MYRREPAGLASRTLRRLNTCRVDEISCQAPHNSDTRASLLHPWPAAVGTSGPLQDSSVRAASSGAAVPGIGQSVPATAASPCVLRVRSLVSAACLNSHPSHHHQPRSSLARPPWPAGGSPSSPAGTQPATFIPRRANDLVRRHYCTSRPHTAACVHRRHDPPWRLTPG